MKVNNAEAKKTMTYWEDMVDSGLADTVAYGTTDFYNGLASGKYATYLAAGWGPGYLQSVAKTTSGKWRAAPLPQWDAGENLQGDWGGSSFAVTDQTEHPEEATTGGHGDLRVATRTPGRSASTRRTCSPPPKPILEWDYFLNKEYEFFGGQKVNEIFVPAYNGVGEYDWSAVQQLQLQPAHDGDQPGGHEEVLLDGRAGHGAAERVDVRHAAGLQGYPVT